MAFRDQLCDLPDLEAELFQLLKQIPSGRVTTYGDLARALGDEQARAARWIGELLKSHDHNERCSCHRVVRSNGEVGLYVEGDPSIKIEILRDEGLPVSTKSLVDLSQRFTDFETTNPLQALKEFQLDLTKRAKPEGEILASHSVAGVDVAYPDKNSAVGAYVEMDTKTKEMIYERTIKIPVEFPYLPGYLSFRELPVLLELLDEVSKEHALADILFVDGNGLLHPWRAGIAVCLGVLIDRPTIGFGKSLLCGSVALDEMSCEEFRPVVHNEETVGLAMKSKTQSKPVYVSPGHLIGLEASARLAKSWMMGHRLPEPVFLADRLTKRGRR